jgi:hypothetical protein
MNKLYMIITNSGDGSNSIRWVTDEAVLAKMEELADDGDESYASGDGLQSQELVFPDGFDLASWVATNHLSLTTMDDMDY